MGHRVRDLTNTVTQGDLIPQYMLVDVAGNPLTSAAAALADAAANPTVGGMGAYSLVYNGATWDRQSSANADSLTGVAATQLRGFAGNRIATYDTAAGGDAAAGTRQVAIGNYLWNGTSADRQRTNLDTAALITAAGATTSQTGADQTNYNGRGLIVVLDMTVVGTGSVTLTIQGKDVASGKYYTLLAGAAVVTNVTNAYTVYPGAPATANVSANSPLPRTWRVITTANNANAATYTVGASVIV